MDSRNHLEIISKRGAVSQKKTGQEFGDRPFEEQELIRMRSIIRNIASTLNGKSRKQNPEAWIPPSVFYGNKIRKNFKNSVFGTSPGVISGKKNPDKNTKYPR